MSSQKGLKRPRQGIYDRKFKNPQPGRKNPSCIDAIGVVRICTIGLSSIGQTFLARQDILLTLKYSLARGIDISDHPTSGIPQTASNVLVYEDDEACGLAYATILQRAGYHVTLTNHFEPALNALSPVHMLITDIYIPNGLNGVALARMARMRNPQIKIVYVTGYDVAVLKLGLVGPLLRKPVTDEQLLAVVAAGLRSDGTY